MTAIPDLSARAIVAGVAAGAFSARDVARAHLARIAADEPRVRVDLKLTRAAAWLFRRFAR